MPVEVTPRAIEVFRRALELGRMDPDRVGIRVLLARGLRGEEIRTGFAEQAEPDEETVRIGDLKLFLPADLAGRDTTIDVAAEHDQIVLL